MPTLRSLPCELLDPAKLINATEYVYGTYMAQVPNTQRIPRPAPAFVSATLVDPSSRRLVRDWRSTRVLRALLAVVGILTVAAFLQTDPRAVVPKNPCSIAAVTGLLAGSELLKLMPEGAEFMSPEELEEKVFKGSVFGMGWWGEGGNKRFGIDVGRAGKEP